MTPLVPLDDRTFVAGQIFPEDMARVVAAGVTLIVNNRPDHEEPDQPTADDIREAAEAAGLRHRHIPVAGSLSPAQAEAMAEALDQTEGRLLAFCRSGTRSTWLWALARARRGGDADTLIRQAAQAGYDLTPLRPHLSHPGASRDP